jgi:hypothetical protein
MILPRQLITILQCVLQCSEHCFPLWRDANILAPVTYACTSDSAKPQRSGTALIKLECHPSLTMQVHHSIDLRTLARNCSGGGQRQKMSVCNLICLNFHLAQGWGAWCRLRVRHNHSYAPEAVCRCRTDSRLDALAGCHFTHVAVLQQQTQALGYADH